jgi:hypothetical protein
MALARFQYNPNVRGTNKETKLNAEDSPTSSKISCRDCAIQTEAKVTKMTPTSNNQQTDGHQKVGSNKVSQYFLPKPPQVPK